MSFDPAAAAAMINSKLNGAARPAPVPPPPLVWIDPSMLAGVPVPVRQWIVPDWIPVGVATGLYGPGGLGKSLLALQLITAAAIGARWLGVPVAPVRSLAVFCEDDEDELHRRQEAINRFYGCSYDALGAIRWLPRVGEANVFMTFGKSGLGELTDFAHQIFEEAKDHGAKLVIFDTLADGFAGNQNDAGHARQFVQGGLARLARHIGGAVVAPAHPSKAGMFNGTGESGSVQWDAAFRSRLYLSPPAKEEGEAVDPDARVLTRKKANYAARDETIELRWVDGVLVTEGGDELDLGKTRPDAETVFLALLDKMIKEGQTLSPNSRAGNYAPKLFTSRSERHGYRRADFERAMQALLAMGEIRVERYGRNSHGADMIVRVGVEPPLDDDQPRPF